MRCRVSRQVAMFYQINHEKDLFGYSAVYMIFLGNSIFFFTMFLLTLNLNSSRQFS